MLVVSTEDIITHDKKPIVFCRKGDILNVIADHGNAYIVFKNMGFAIRKSKTETINMTKEKLLESVYLTIERIREPSQFPYEFLFEILSGKEWKDEFAEMVQKSEIQSEIKTKILDEINS